MVEVKQNKEFYTFWLLKGAARENLQMLENNSRCNGYARMEAMLLSALAMEAYLNHVGPFLLNSWETIEKSLGPKQKLVLILEVLSHSPSMGHRPYQTFHDMFKFRNLLAHGRTRKVIDHISNQDRIPGMFPEEPETDIEMLITNENASRYVTDMIEMMNDLAEQPKIKEITSPPYVLSSCSFESI